MNRNYYSGLSGGILLIGIGILFLVPGIHFWPWILVVVGAAGLPASLASKQGWLGWQGFFWMVGLAILFETSFWPGILILVGVSMLFGALTRENAGSPFATGRPASQPTASPSEDGSAVRNAYQTQPLPEQPQKRSSDTKPLSTDDDPKP